MEDVKLSLKWYHTFLFLFQTILSVADTTTDILTCLKYKQQGDERWFAVSLAVTVVAAVVLCIWSVIASILRSLTAEDDAVADAANPDVIFRSSTVNVLLGCLCVGPPLHSFQMFLVCAFRFKELWRSDRGLRVEKKDRLYYLYVHTLNLKMVEGLLESAPQLIIQLYVMLKTSEQISLIQMISAPISLLSLTWMITCMEVFREFSNTNMKFLHNFVIFVSNLCIMAARTVALVAFCHAFPWWLSLVLCAHCFLVNVCGYLLWKSERKQDMLTFIFAYSPLYLLIYSSYQLKKLRGNKPFSFPLQLAVSIAWHLVFTAENIFMISMYYHKTQDRKWIDYLGVSIVVGGTVGGILFKWILWCCCVAKESLETERRQPVTIRI